MFKNSTDTKREFVGAKISYKEHALAYLNHSFKTRGSPEAITSITIFKKYGVKLAGGGRNATS